MSRAMSTAQNREIGLGRAVRRAKQRWLAYVVDYDEGRVKSPRDPPVAACGCAACAPARGQPTPLACRVTSESQREARRRRWAMIRESRRSARASRERASLPALPCQRACTADEVRRDHLRARIVAAQNAWQLAGYGQPPSEAMFAFAAESAAETGCRLLGADADTAGNVAAGSRPAAAAAAAAAAPAAAAAAPPPPAPAPAPAAASRFRALTASSRQLRSPHLSTVRGLALALSWLVMRRVAHGGASERADGLDLAVRVAVRMAPMRTPPPPLPVRSPVQIQYGAQSTRTDGDGVAGTDVEFLTRGETGVREAIPRGIDGSIRARLSALGAEMGALVAGGECSVVRRGSELWELLCHNAARGFAFVLDNGVDTFAVGPDAQGFPRVVHTTCFCCRACATGSPAAAGLHGTRRTPGRGHVSESRSRRVLRSTPMCHAGGRHVRPPSPLCPEHVGSGVPRSARVRYTSPGRGGAELLLRQAPGAENAAHGGEPCIGDSMLWVVIRIPPCSPRLLPMNRPDAVLGAGEECAGGGRNGIRPPPRV